MVAIEERRCDLGLMSLGTDRTVETAILGAAWLPARAECVRLARLFTRNVLGLGGIGADVIEVAGVIVSELVTNVVVHDDWDLEPFAVVSFRRAGSTLRIEVHDSDSYMGPRKPSGEDAEGGRGLSLVAALSARWGVDETSSGKCVWAELELGADLPAEDGA